MLEKEKNQQTVVAAHTVLNLLNNELNRKTSPELLELLVNLLENPPSPMEASALLAVRGQLEKKRPDLIENRPGKAPEVKKIYISETRDAAQAVMAGVESEPEKQVSFAEAVKLLEGKLDLEVARTNAVKSHRRWGVVDALVKAGIIKDTSEYAALFDKVTFCEDDLKKVSRMLGRGEKVLPIFDCGEMTPDKLFSVLFFESGFPFHWVRDDLNHLAKMRRIDPKDIPDLENLADKSIKEQITAYIAAYKKAKPVKPTGARVLFTPNKFETKPPENTAIKEMQAFARGEMSFLDPNADFLRNRLQIDEKLSKYKNNNIFNKLNDEDYRRFFKQAIDDDTVIGLTRLIDDSKQTRYPNYALENGEIPQFGFNIMLPKLSIGFNSPGAPGGIVGGRLSIG